MYVSLYYAELGIRRGNEDFRGNENRKSQQQKIFPRKNKLTSILLLKQFVGVAESMEIMP